MKDKLQKKEEKSPKKKEEKSPELPPKKWLPEPVLETYRKTRPYVFTALVVALQLIYFFPDVAKIPILIILGGFLLLMVGDLSKLIEAHVGEVKSTLGEINQNIKEIEDPLHKAAFSSNLGSPQAEVARKMYEASIISAEQLKKPKEVFKNHQEYTSALTNRINRMIPKKRGKISAACGQKEWDDRLVQQWFDKNYEALRRNISITRIFLEEKGWKIDDVKRQEANDEMQKQADNGINVRHAKLQALQHIEVFKDFPEGFGFVIFKYYDEPSEVIVHNNPAKDESLLFDDPLIVSQFISAFNKLNEYSKKIDSNKQTDAGLLLEKVILQKLTGINNQVEQLLAHRFSNIQLYFVKWRLASELKNIKLLANGNIPIHAADKFTYLTDVFRHVIEQLKERDIYQTISTVDFWSGNSQISYQCLKATSDALKNGAKIERVIFVDKEKLDVASDYRNNIKKIIGLFENFKDKNHELYSIGFLICDLNDEVYGKLLEYSPCALITESDKKNRLEITTKHGPARHGAISPQLSLKFYNEDETDASVEAMDNNFQTILSNSITVIEMKDELYKLS